MTTHQIPRYLLKWRFGDPITIEHRMAVADWLAEQGRYSPEVARATRKICLTEPDKRFAEILAPFVGAISAMNIATFVSEFPALAKKDADGMVLETFVRMKFPREGAPL